MRLLAPLWIVALSAAVAGCADRGPLPQPSLPASPGLSDLYDLERGFAAPYNATGCREGGAVLLVDPAQAARSLPAGFRAADAKGLLGLPGDTGKAAIYVNSVACAASELDASGAHEGQVAVYVEPPTVPVEPPDAIPFYEVLRFTSDENAFDLLQHIGWAVSEGVNEIAVAPQPGGAATANGKVSDESGVLYTIGLTAPNPDRLSGTARFWHNAPGGLAYVDYTVDMATASGAASCTIRAGSHVHAVTGVTTCGPGQALALVFPAFDWQGRVVYLPNVRAA